ncbi:hypothetical protein H311_00408, partial [Anncaliia algerae PRA109]
KYSEKKINLFKELALQKANILRDILPLDSVDVAMDKVHSTLVAIHRKVFGLSSFRNQYQQKNRKNLDLPQEILDKMLLRKKLKKAFSETKQQEFLDALIKVQTEIKAEVKKYKWLEWQKYVYGLSETRNFSNTAKKISSLLFRTDRVEISRCGVNEIAHSLFPTAVLTNDRTKRKSRSFERSPNISLFEVFMLKLSLMDWLKTKHLVGVVLPRGLYVSARRILYSSDRHF